MVFKSVTIGSGKTISGLSGMKSLGEFKMRPSPSL